MYESQYVAVKKYINYSFFTFITGKIKAIRPIMRVS